MFPNRYATRYSPAGFKTEWSKLMDKVLELKKIGRRFTFHDLRAYYVTRHKAERGALPDLHANPATRARVYDRTKIVKRGGM
ncbi:integrase [Burkholderia vietnamiensis]|nr:integrase [Burkholderia vietnamiensis]